MSFAPASSLGAFLKARLAVNGIQCAARSFGKLTAAGRGLLSSMGASCVLEILATPGQAISFAVGRKRHRIAIFPLIRAVGDRPSQIGGADPEHFALGKLRTARTARHPEPVQRSSTPFTDPGSSISEPPSSPPPPPK